MRSRNPVETTVEAAHKSGPPVTVPSRWTGSQLMMPCTVRSVSTATRQRDVIVGQFGEPAG